MAIREITISCSNPTHRGKSRGVRLIPISNEENIAICEECYEVLMREEEQREREGNDRILPDVPYNMYPRIDERFKCPEELHLV